MKKRRKMGTELKRAMVGRTCLVFLAVGSVNAKLGNYDVVVYLLTSKLDLGGISYNLSRATTGLWSVEHHVIVAVDQPEMGGKWSGLARYRGDVFNGMMEV